MSFICYQCKASTLPRLPATPIIVETRKVKYLNYDAEGDEVHSKGTEIVKQVNVCPSCAEDFPKEMRG